MSSSVHLARDRPHRRWQVSWLTGHCLLPTFPGGSPPSGHKLAASSPLTVAGAATALDSRKSSAPCSLLVPSVDSLGNHHDNSIGKRPEICQWCLQRSCPSMRLDASAINGRFGQALMLIDAPCG